MINNDNLHWLVRYLGFPWSSPIDEDTDVMCAPLGGEDDGFAHLVFYRDEIFGPVYRDSDFVALAVAVMRKCEIEHEVVYNFNPDGATVAARLWGKGGALSHTQTYKLGTTAADWAGVVLQASYDILIMNEQLKGLP